MYTFPSTKDQPLLNATQALTPSHLQTYLFDLLEGLAGVRQSPRYHPEGDALYHSLQTFVLARRATDDRALQAAALLHDVGKALASAGHAEIGANDLQGLVSARIVWLVRHHMHLLLHPKKTRRWLRNTPQLRELERLRQWDLGGRLPGAYVPEPEEAIAWLMMDPAAILPKGADFYFDHHSL